MTGRQSNFDRLVDELEQQRDELLLKIHLAKAEARDEWEELEDKWQNLQQRLPEARKAAGESADNIGAALGLVAEDAAARPPLVIPASAPLITGKRAVVYVAHPEKEGIFEGREIVLGPNTELA